MNASMTPTDSERETESETEMTVEQSKAIQRPYFHAEEDESGATLQIALPGVRKEDLKLTFQESNLRIEGQRCDRCPENWRTIRDTNPAQRYGLNIRLTARLDGSKTVASYEDGILTLKVPICEEAKPREIAVT
jgi:HSP20 family protein